MMGDLNGCQNHQNEDAVRHKGHLHVQDPVAVAVARKTFEEKWSENPRNT